MPALTPSPSPGTPLPSLQSSQLLYGTPVRCGQKPRSSASSTALHFIRAGVANSRHSLSDVVVNSGQTQRGRLAARLASPTDSSNRQRGEELDWQIGSMRLLGKGLAEAQAAAMQVAGGRIAVVGPSAAVKTTPPVPARPPLPESKPSRPPSPSSPWPLRALNHRRCHLAGPEVLAAAGSLCRRCRRCSTVSQPGFAPSTLGGWF